MPSEDPPPDEPLWTKAETLILMAHLEAFVKGDKCSRKELLISTVLPKMKKHRRDMAPEQWKHRKLQIKWWFYNHKEPDKTDFDLGRKTHLKTIISHLWGEELRALASERCGHDSGSQPFFKMYSTVYADFRKSMTPEQNRQAKEAQRTWEVQHPPELQYKNVGLHSEKVLLSVAKMLYREFGMTVIIGEYHKINEHQSAFLVHDFSKTVGVNCPEKSFTDLHPTLIDQFKKALIKQMSYELLRSLEVPSDEETGTESQVPTRSSTPSRRQLPHLQCDPHGYPFLPPLLPGGESTPQQRDLVRKFVTVQYRIACGRPEDPVPWRLLSADNSLFIDGAYLNVKLEDPGLMSKPDLTKLLKFWRDRQADGPISEVLRFCRCLQKRNGKTMVPVTYDPIVDHQRLGEQPGVGADVNMFNDDLIDPSLWEMADAPMPPQSPPPSASPPPELSPHPPISPPRPLSPPAPPSLLVESPGIMAPTQAVSPPSPVLPSTSCGSGTGTSPGPLRPTKLAPVPSNLPAAVPEADPHPLMSSKPRSRHSENIPTMPIVGGRRPVKPTAKAIAAKEQQEAAQRRKRALSAASDKGTKKSRTGPS